MTSRPTTRISMICAALALAVGALAACADLPTAADTEPIPDDCIVIDGVIYCPPGM